jgi:hypothetical protein
VAAALRALGADTIAGDTPSITERATRRVLGELLLEDARSTAVIAGRVFGGFDRSKPSAVRALGTAGALALRTEHSRRPIASALDGLSAVSVDNGQGDRRHHERSQDEREQNAYPAVHGNSAWTNPSPIDNINGKRRSELFLAGFGKGEYMKLGHVVLALLIFGAGAYWVYDVYTQQENRIRDLEQQLRSLRAGPAQQASATKAEQQPQVTANAAPQRISCPACLGEGRLMVRLSGGQDKPYACPICGSLGYRTMVMPAGAQTCSDCLGMGKRPYSMRSHGFVAFESAKEQTERLTARPCMRCGGTGCLRIPPTQ